MASIINQPVATDSADGPCCFAYGSCAFVCATASTACIYNLHTGEMLATLEGHSDWINCLALSEKENALFTGSNDETVKKWDLKTGTLQATLEGHSNAIRCLAISEKENALLTGSDDKTVKKWDLKTGTLQTTLEGHSKAISCLAISEKENALLTGSEDQDVRMWHLQTHELLLRDRIHASAVQGIVCTADGMVLSVSTKLAALDVRSLIHHSVLISTTLPTPGFSAEARYLPWALLAAAKATKVSAVAQLASFAFIRKQAMPPRWKRPAKVLDDFADLGLPIEDAVDFQDLHAAAIVTVLFFTLLLYIAAGPLQRAKFLFAERKLAKYGFLGIELTFKLFTGACFLPLLKTLLWPLAAGHEPSLMLAMGVVTSGILVTLVARLTRVDTQLACLEMRLNFLDWSNDRCMLEVDEEQGRSHARARKQVHPLSAKSPSYDIYLLSLRALAMLNSLFCARLSDHQIAMAAIRVVLGAFIVALGLQCDCYFPAILSRWDYNGLQTGLDSGILATYIAALVAVVAMDYCDEEVLDSVWLALAPLFAFPAVCLGYFLRRNRHVTLAVHAQRPQYEPLLP